MPTSPTPRPPAIEIEGLRKTYGDQTVLDGLDLVVPAGTEREFLEPLPVEAIWGEFSAPLLRFIRRRVGDQARPDMADTVTVDIAAIRRARRRPDLVADVAGGVGGMCGAAQGRTDRPGGGAVTNPSPQVAPSVTIERTVVPERGGDSDSSPASPTD